MGLVPIPETECFGTMSLIGSDTFGWEQLKYLESRNLQSKHRIVRQNVSPECARLGQIWPTCPQPMYLGLLSYDMLKQTFSVSRSRLSTPTRDVHCDYGPPFARNQ